jgi:hypothetical protein
MDTSQKQDSEQKKPDTSVNMLYVVCVCSRMNTSIVTEIRVAAFCGRAKWVD